MTYLPTGTVTFLLTDIEGSVRLWNADPRAMVGLLARHDELIDSIVDRQDGTLVKSRAAGDSAFAVFDDPSTAVSAALAIQRGMRAEPWPPGHEISVRIGVHTGVAELRDGDYYGAPVSLCARLRDAGYGGQTLVSDATRELLVLAPDSEVRLVERGFHVLRDFDQPVRVFEAVSDGISTDGRPLRVRRAHYRRLPEELTSFVGRGRELSAIQNALAECRLLTLTGAGGTVKTRLALQVARSVSDTFTDGVLWIALADLPVTASVTREIGTALGVRDEPGFLVEDVVVDTLRGRQLLIVIDNCEHLIDSCCEAVDVLLRSCHDVKILATSREALRTVGEHTWTVPPLSLPRRDRDVGDLSPSDSDAVQLFMSRALARHPDFVLTEGDAVAVSEICHRLDGIPLSIELAAAHVGMLSPEQIADQVDQNLDLLRTRLRSAPHRHRSLHAAMAWGYDLLSESEQVLFRRLAVFSGWFDLESAVAVGQGDSIAEHAVVELLTCLHEKSVIVVERSTGSTMHYRLLEPLRQFGLEELDSHGEIPAMRRRHAESYLAMAAESANGLKGPDQAAWLARIERAHENIRSALEWAIVEPDVGLGLRLGSAMWRFWFMRGHRREGHSVLVRLLALSDPADRGYVRADALHASGTLACFLGDYSESRADLDECLSIRRELGDEAGVAATLNNLGITHLELGEYPEASKRFEESLARKRDRADRYGVATSLANLTLASLEMGDYETAQSCADQSLSIKRELGDDRSSAISLTMMGRIAEDRGEYDRASALYDESMAIFSEMGDVNRIAEQLHLRGHISHVLCDTASARRYYQESLDLSRQIGDRSGIAQTLVNFAGLELDEGRPDEAIELLSEAEHLSRAQRRVKEISDTLNHLSRALSDLGDQEKAKTKLAESLTILRRIGHRILLVQLIETAALLSAADGDAGSAFRLMGAAESERSRVGVPRAPNAVERLYRATAHAARELGGEEATAAADAGRGLTLEQACDIVDSYLQPLS